MAGVFRFFISDGAPWDGRQLHIARQDGIGSYGVFQPVVMRRVEPGDTLDASEPFMRETGLSKLQGEAGITEFLQAAMDEAWRLGLRPKAFELPENELRATKYHLEDMRRFAKVPGAVEAVK